MKNSLPRSYHLALALVAVTAIACSSRTAATTSGEPAAVTLAVQNSSGFQVNVFAVPSVPTARIRLGSIGPLSSGQLEIPTSALAPGGALKVMVDPVGSTTQWTSQTINVSADLRPCLRVMADASGDLGRSTLITQVAGTSGCM